MYPLYLLKVVHDVVALVEEGADNLAHLDYVLDGRHGEDLVLQGMVYWSTLCEIHNPVKL